ncbi:hypothetical protein BJY16_006002 [Actinoplanes octamycinicus]|uniref:Uncharacterized protein n=1 Tax=Actinoplanes octamycinicus TaxID=135948 RepID=A0A7W7H215_9ACTN|nr:hypothetical protein [Actinoplanes octamycinicus]MBB4742543.1 hypothetical protein [Actinoplanes octamycinicus]
MDWAVIGAAVGLGAIIVRGVMAFGMAGKEIGKLRTSGQGVRQLREQAQARRWTWDPPGNPTVPVGRMAALPGLRQRGAAHGRFRQRQASAAVLVALVDSGFKSRLGNDHGTNAFSLVVTIEAPELTGDLHVDPRPGGAGSELSGSLAPLVTGELLARLDQVRRPALDIVDGQASFVYLSLRDAAELDRLLAAGDDVVSGLCNLQREEHP